MLTDNEIAQMQSWLAEGRAAFARHPRLGILEAWRADGYYYAETRRERLHYRFYSVGYAEARGPWSDWRAKYVTTA